MTFKTIRLIWLIFCLFNVSVGSAQSTPKQFLNAGLKCLESGEYDSSIYLFQEGITRSEQINSTALMTGLTLELGNANSMKMNYTEAFRIYSSLEKGLKTGKEYEDLGKVYIAFIEFYRKRAKFEKAKEYIKLMNALLLKENISSESEGKFYGRCAAVEIEGNGNLRKSLYYSNKALKLAEKTANHDLEATALNEIGFAYENLKPSQAAAYYLKALNIWSEMKNDRSTVTALGNLGRLSSKLGHSENAKAYYLRGLDIADQHGFLVVKKDMLLNLHLIYKNNEEYEKSIDALTGFYNTERLEASLENNKNLLEIESKYGLEKEINKRNIAVQRAQIAEAETKTKTFQNYLWGAFSVCLILLLFVISRLLYKLKKGNLRVKSSNLELAKTINQKEIIFRELHHRVKNNLSILNSLLFLQAKDSVQEETKRILAECQSRIHSMAVVHENLLEVNSSNKVELKSFVHKLFTDLKESFLPKESTNNLLIEGDDVSLDMSTSLFIGFALNELVTNSMKYAESTPLELGISFSKQNEQLTINYWDNGVGLPDEKKDLTQGGFGFKLIRIMMDQLDSEIKYSNSNGKSLFSFSFNFVQSI